MPFFGTHALDREGRTFDLTGGVLASVHLHRAVQSVRNQRAGASTPARRKTIMSRVHHFQKKVERNLAAVLAWPAVPDLPDATERCYACGFPIYGVPVMFNDKPFCCTPCIPAAWRPRS